MKKSTECTDKHRISVPVVLINAKCAEFNMLDDYNHLTECGNTMCPFYYMSQCPFMFQMKTKVTVKVESEGDMYL